MPGNREGGKKTAKKVKARLGDDFYKKIGAKGGRKSRNGGFAKNVKCNCDVISEPHLTQNCAGIKGGRKGKRGKAKNA